jgi:two-component system, sensor histidine kinase and response regulator
MSSMSEVGFIQSARSGETWAVRNGFPDSRAVVRLLRSSFVLATLVSLIGYLAETSTSANSVALDLRLGHLSLPSGLFVPAVSLLAVALSLTPFFARFWKPITLDLCLGLIAGLTHVTILEHQQVQLFVVILVVLVASCALLPWGLGWQAMLSAGCIALAGLNTMLVHPATPVIGYLWLELLAASGLTLLSNRLWAEWRNAFTETNGKLRAEIAERKAAQKKLQESETALRRIFDTCPEIISIVSMVDGRCIDINPQFSVTGYSRLEAIAGTSDAIGLWADRARFHKFMSELSAHGVVHNVEADLRFKDGTTRPCLVSGALVEIGYEPCAVTFMNDITQLKQTERQLIAAREEALAGSRAKSEFLSSMSHEIRTPLNSILGMADLLGETALTQEQRRFVEIMTGNGNALLDLISGILDLAKVESGRLNLEETEFDLEELVEGVAETLSVRAHAKGLELSTRILAGVPLKLIGDPLRLRQVLINLTANAVKFTNHGEVALTVENRPEMNCHGPECAHRTLSFSVRDTGIGIPADKIAAIFQSFTQVDSSVTRRYGGSGLGLAIARRLVDLMGGSISVKSQVGWGSTFSFAARFTAAAESKATPAESKAPPAEPELAGLRLLVVDDNATNRSIISEIFRSQGARVAESTDGKKAFARCEHARRMGEPYDLVLLDFSLPDIDGLAVAERLRRESGGAQPIVVMLASDNLSAKLSRLQEVGLRDYLLKPLKRSAVLRAMATALGKVNAPEVAPAPKPSTDAPRRPLRILLADDSCDNRTLIKAYLKSLPYTLDEAENGEVAGEKFTKHDYDLVLMDMQMPVLDGYEATRRIRLWEQEHSRPATPILALTASALSEDVRNTLEAGCTAHLSKPVKKSRLLEVINDLLGSQTSSPTPAEARLVAPAAAA